MNLNKQTILGFARRLAATKVSTTSVRNARWIKPWNIGPEGEWKKARGRKMVKVELPDFEQMKLDDKLGPEQIRSKLKEKGIAPPRAYTERTMYMPATGGILDPFVPPEGDGKASLVSSEGAKQRFDRLTKKGRSFMALRKIRTYEDELDLPTFAEEALQIYIRAHKALTTRDLESLHDLVTEYAFPEMTFKLDEKTIRWQFISEIDRPLVSHIRTLDVLSKNNLFAQMTVRLHTRQILAIYDRFGCLIHGSEAVVKDVLEYVVFEKHLANLYGKWRIHAKIIPNWMPPKEGVLQTFVSPPEPPPMSDRELRYEKEGLMSDQKKGEKKDKKEIEDKKEGSTPPTPALA